MAGEKIEKNEGGVFEDIKNSLSSLFNNIKNFNFKSFINDTFGKEVFKIEESIKNDLKKLESSILGLDKDKLGNKQLDDYESITFEDYTDKTKPLGMLASIDTNIGNWFVWAKDIEDKDGENKLKDIIVDKILSILRKESDDNNNGFGDLYDSEVAKIGECLLLCKTIEEDNSLYGEGKIPEYVKGNKGKILEALLNVISGSDNIKPKDIKNKMIDYLKNIKPEDLETPTPEQQEETPTEEPTGDEIETPEEPEGENPQN